MRASEISVMRSHRTGARMTLEGKMGSLTLDVGRWSNCLDRASALPFLDPGRKVTLKSKYEKNRDHLACLGLSRLADLMYSRLR